MRILFLDDVYKDKVFNVIKSEPSFHYDEKWDLNFLNVNMYMVLDDKNNIIGFFGLSSMSFALCVCYLYVFENYRMQGYAKKILNFIKEKYSKDYPYIYLLVDKNNLRAIKLYKNYCFLASDNISFIPGNMFEKAERDNSLYVNEDSYEVILHYKTDDKIKHKSFILKEILDSLN